MPCSGRRAMRPWKASPASRDSSSSSSGKSPGSILRTGRSISPSSSRRRSVSFSCDVRAKPIPNNETNRLLASQTSGTTTVITVASEPSYILPLTDSLNDQVERVALKRRRRHNKSSPHSSTAAPKRRRSSRQNSSSISKEDSSISSMEESRSASTSSSPSEHTSRHHSRSGRNKTRRSTTSSSRRSSLKSRSSRSRRSSLRHSSGSRRKTSSPRTARSRSSTPRTARALTPIMTTPSGTQIGIDKQGRLRDTMTGQYVAMKHLEAIDSKHRRHSKSSRTEE